MTRAEFIFSEKGKYKLLRHAAFWGIYCIIYFVRNLSPGSIEDFKTLILFKNSFYYVVFFLPVHMMLVYTFIYVLIPRFIERKKYVLFAIALFCICLFCFGIGFVFGWIFLNLIVTDPHYHTLLKDLIVSSFDNTVNSGLAVGCIAIGIKLAKNIYVQQKENTRLAAEESNNRIKLMKSQMQPDFLYHSLTNLQKKICYSPDGAAGMILHLSEIFSYILYDCNPGQIPLESELAALRHLIAIENNNDVERTETSLSVYGTVQNKYIVPLSLFSVIQQINIDKDNWDFQPENMDWVIDIDDNVIILCLLTGGRGDHTIKVEVPLCIPVAHYNHDMYMETIENEPA